MRRWTLLCCILFAACGGSDDPTRPAETLGGFALEFADDVRVHTPVELTVRAVGDAGTSPFTGFSGTVELALDQGVIEPASIEVVDGIGSAAVTISGTDEPPTLTATAGERTGTLSFEIGRFETTGTLVVGDGSIRPQSIARVRLPNGDVVDDRTTNYDVVTPVNLFKAFGAALEHETREGTASARGLSQFDSTILASETSLLVDWVTVTAGAATGFDEDLRAVGVGSLLGSLIFEVVGEPLLFELQVSTDRQADKGTSCVGGVILTHTPPGGQMRGLANLVNANETLSGVFEPGTYALRFDTTAIAESDTPTQIVSNLNFDIRLRVQR